MILGLGCDIVQVSRFLSDEKFLLRFIKIFFSADTRTRSHRYPRCLRPECPSLPDG